MGIGSTFYYKTAYVDNRRFQELANTDINKNVGAHLIDYKLRNLKWITPNYSNNPEEEISFLNDTIKTLKNDKRKKMLITHYQFISSLLPDYTISPNRTYTHDSISYPKKGDEYFEIYKNFFLNQIVKNNIEIIYIIKPLEKNVFDSLINDECLKSKKINKILTTYLIIDCEKLKK